MKKIMRLKESAEEVINKILTFLFYNKCDFCGGRIPMSPKVGDIYIGENTVCCAKCWKEKLNEASIRKNISQAC